jgi:Short C-terminal domain
MRRRGMMVAPARMGRPGLLGTMARTAVVAGTATAVSGNVARRGDRRAAEQDQNNAMQQQQAMGDQQQAMADQGPAQAAAPSAADQLSQLSTLHQQGALTDDEFAAAKAKILGT